VILGYCIASPHRATWALTLPEARAKAKALGRRARIRTIREGRGLLVGLDLFALGQLRKAQARKARGVRR
jgi:hypothetical protein